ncbi:MAG: NUDIX domain-containing protein [Thermoleophilia bacterium]|nr:NUDIX domain-containing protein [Thermoleophilia bacterium]
MAADTPSAIPDVLAPGLACVFCGINPGRVSAAAAAHFANPRNDFWRLLHDAGFTPRLYDPSEQFSLLDLGIGVTNAAYRTTPGSGDLRGGDFDAARLERMVRELHPVAIAFVGKEAYRGLFNERAELGPQIRTVGATGLYVLPSTSPANAAVPYDERLRWFSALYDWLHPEKRLAVRALVVDDERRILLVPYENPVTKATWWGTPGGGIEAGETHEHALRRELREEIGLEQFEPGPLVWEHEREFPWNGRLLWQHNSVYLVRVPGHEPRPTIDLTQEGVAGHRWWTMHELEATRERLAPPDFLRRVRGIIDAHDA